ncbi:hypothetical protein ECTPHS_13773 [Ectothiorhodospira sp. PHS-1]|uniref:Ig domain-containing protein n=1 Tax=Ectothiorhodospira sp. PHS-1 TaxID=519989 RepID=UPI00024A8ACD|nr:Ig domain-containing protein [Ectothiorhodospira sp. PHS-1]EHQ53731.1 hypothetical protein ECTPHS_13773 [Ectothiorhodospira sp. PHS-1]
MGSTATSGTPEDILIVPELDVIFIRGLNALTTTRVQTLVLDEARGSVADPAPGINNVLVEMLFSPGTGNGAYLTGRNAAGRTMRGNALLLPSKDGVVTFTAVAGNTPGFMGLRVWADQSDNNVDNGLSWPVSDVGVVVVTSTGMGGILSIQTDELPEGAVDLPYFALLEVTGGIPPYNWQIAGGGLPPGLALTPSGAISGTPTAVGNYCFALTVTDSETPVAQIAGPLRACIEVGRDPASPVEITTTSLPSGTTTQSYAQILQATGGVPPYTWSIIGNPPWLNLSPAGVLYYDAASAVIGTYNFGVTLTDSGGQQVSAAYTLVVN